MESDLLRERLDHLRSALLTASEGRYPPPRIIAVTKTHPAEMILPLAGLGIQEIGENRVQEIREKVPLLDGKFAVHLIGRLQTNKVKYIMKDVVMIQSLDRMELAHEINRQALKHGMVMPVLVQVSPAGEEQKGGIDQIREEAIPGIDMEELSMGMSGDYLYAARHGATMVRVGSAIFGPRDYGPK